MCVGRPEKDADCDNTDEGKQIVQINVLADFYH